MNLNLPLFTKRTQTFNAFILIPLVAVLISACGSGQEPPKVLAELVPTQGTVTLDGKPLSGATVTFIPEDGQKGTRRASAICNESGVYELITPIAKMKPEETKGIAPGKYKVTISKYLMKDGSAIPADTVEADAMALGAKESVPAKYSNFEKSTLKIEVERSTVANKSHDFDLKSK